MLTVICYVDGYTISQLFRRLHLSIMLTVTLFVIRRQLHYRYYSDGYTHLLCRRSTVIRLYFIYVNYVDGYTLSTVVLRTFSIECRQTPFAPLSICHQRHEPDSLGVSLRGTRPPSALLDDA